LGLLILAGISGLSVVRQIQTRNQRIREDYVRRDRTLEQLRERFGAGVAVREDALTRAKVQRAAARALADGPLRSRAAQAAALVTALRAEDRLPAIVAGLVAGRFASGMG